MLGASAWADDGKSRYVAGSGRDEGDCLNKFRPCRSLDYAVARAGKTDTLEVADGNYDLDSAQQLTNLLSVTGRIRAGYNRHTGFTDRNAIEKTVLTGVPPALRERFENSGFTVIADTKGFIERAFDSPEVRAESQRMHSLATTVLESEQSHAMAPCVAGQAAGFPCSSVSLLSHLSLQQLLPASTRGADVWGFTDLNTGREYAIMGLDNGVAVVDITDPTLPEQVAYTTGANTIWREVTTYQRYDLTAKRWRAYAYITADRAPDRLLVLDLSNLPNGVERVGFTSEFASAHSDYMVNADYTYGIPETPASSQLVVSGAGINGGNYRMYSLANPRAPSLLSVSSTQYAHDVASFGVTDARKNTQCINAALQPKCQVLTDFNEDSIDVWDVTNPSSVQLLGRRTYPNASYVHSGWWTEDGRYLLAHDELDEQNFGLPTIVRVFDMSVLAAPSLVANWVGPTRAIDHNGYVRGNRYYFSNYSEGLTVLDITNPTAPTRIGFFDTYPASAQTGFVAAWGAYPFFASGTMIVGDINSGLYMLKNETLNVAQGTLAFSSPSVNGEEGQSVTLSVSRSGGGTGAVSVQLDLLQASTDSSDTTIGSQTLNWADGDTTNKTVTLNLAVDALDEDLELLLVRLKNPQGGATINYPDTAHVHIADAGESTRLRLLAQSISVDDVRAKALLTVTRQGSLAGVTSVSYTTLPSASYSGFTAQQGTLTWTDGDASAKIVSVVLDPARLSTGQSGTFQVQFSSTGNANLENESGGVVASVTATVSVYDSGPPPPLQAPAGSSGKKGGGAMDLAWLALLAMLLFSRAVYVRRRLRAN
jgi:choice-of-anchor B domain-containing protein